MRLPRRAAFSVLRAVLAGAVFTAIFAFAGSGFGAVDATAHDLLIRGARVIDGTGAPGLVADVAVRNGRISRIGELGEVRAARVIDAQGLVLAPGFIDLHTHADRGILRWREAENYVRQGVTTLVVGNCGSSPTDATAFFRSLHESGAGVNIVLLIGHGSVRVAEMGDRSVPPTAEQLDGMRRRVARMMEAGAVGVSTSLRYRPGAYAETPEVLAVVREAAPYGGFYATHMRDEGLHIEEALEEALQIGREAGVPVHVSHHKISSAAVWGLTRETLIRIDRARGEGMDVTLDHYPYGAGSSAISLMVPQPLVAGGPQAFLERIADEQVRRQTLEAVEQEIHEKLFEPEQNLADPVQVRVALSRIQVARLADETRLEGMNLAEILELRSVPITVRAGAELIVELVGRGASAIYHTIDDRPGGDVDRVMRHPETCIASDGLVFAFGEGHPHPRSYGTFPRVLARYVRERGVLSWEEAIHKMTALPARRLGWTDRGLIQPGFRADLVLFDPERITDTATFANPHSHAEGMVHVWIRGEAVLAGGLMTGLLPGRPVHSVPAANTSEARLRRDVLNLLGQIDGRFGVLVVDGEGRERFAFNADDEFRLADSVNPQTLRQAVFGEIATPLEGESLTLRAEGNAPGRASVAVFAHLRASEQLRLRVIAAYADFPESDTAVAGELLGAALGDLLIRHFVLTL